MRAAVLVAVVLAGCTGADHTEPGGVYLNVVRGEGAAHFIEWESANDGTAGALLVGEALAAAHESQFGARVRQLNDTEQVAVGQWVQTMRAYHPMGSFPIRYMGLLYFVGVDQTSG